MNEFVDQFLLESRELVEQATADLLAVEENPGDSERLDGAFRAFHTLKGSAGIVDFAAMARASHAVEDRLATVRAGRAPVSRELISDCLGALDMILQWLDAMQVDGAIPTGAAAQADALVMRLGTPAVLGPSVMAQADGPVAESELSAAAILLLAAQLKLLEQTSEAGLVGRLTAAGRVAVNVLRSTRLEGKIATLESSAGASAAAEDPARLAEAIAALLPGTNAPQVVEAVTPADTAARVLRVDVDRIDALVNLTGELIVAKNAVGHAAQLAASHHDPDFVAQLLKGQHSVLERLIGELQKSVLSIRVLPLRHVFNRFPKLVREISENLGKNARIVMRGDDTEADKVVVENLFEPLLHIVRNALDHGIELPAERESLGKPAVATIQLRASRNGDVVLVEVQDDGRGIDVDRVRNLAVKRGVVDADAGAQMPPEAIFDLVFAPGFSTVDSVTSLSGRGVGMDVVRRVIENLGGTAAIESRSGAGTTVSMRVPFSVMMTRIMTVRAGGQIFGIPLESVVETAQVPRGKISPIGKSHAFVLRDRTIPLVDLAQCAGLSERAQPAPTTRIVVVSLEGQLGGVEVDEFGDQFDVMLKPLDGILAGTRGVAGTSLLGSGEVLIVLDLSQLLL